MIDPHASVDAQSRASIAGRRLVAALQSHDSFLGVVNVGLFVDLHEELQAAAQAFADAEAEVLAVVRAALAHDQLQSLTDEIEG